jgi:hypothetical protein
MVAMNLRVIVKDGLGRMYKEAFIPDGLRKTKKTL